MTRGSKQPGKPPTFGIGGHCSWWSCNDQNVYLVVNDFGQHGIAWCETDVEATDLETVITDLLEGQYRNPVRVVGFNVVERWARDVSEDIVEEISCAAICS